MEILNYLSTRPYIAYLVNILSLFMAKPHNCHCKTTKRVIRYLKGNVDFGIEYSNHLNIELIGYSDSDWERDPNDKKSTIGYAFSIGSIIVSWRSKKQPTVSLSSTKVEYKALCSSTYEAIWLRHIFEDSGERKGVPTSIKCDNQISIKLTNNPNYHARSKHIENQHHFVREKIQSKEIDLIYSNTHDNVVDIFTKPLGKTKYVISEKDFYKWMVTSRLIQFNPICYLVVTCCYYKRIQKRSSLLLMYKKLVEI